MPLRIRRGTNQDRTGFTPLEGELIYTTDTKRVYVGDGVTEGGVQITSNVVFNNLETDLDLNNFDIVLAFSDIIFTISDIIFTILFLT